MSMPIDPETGIVLIGTYETAKTVLPRLLGPTSDYLGEGLKHLTQQQAQNLRRVFAKAIRLLGRRGDEPGRVPPRILGEILELGAYADDELMAEYLGGLLAASRSTEGVNDRSVFWLGLVRQLPSLTLRSHYVFYKAATLLWADRDIDEHWPKQTPADGIYIPLSTFKQATSFRGKGIHLEVQQIFLQLQQTNLIEEAYAWDTQAPPSSPLGSPQILAPEPGLIFFPSSQGIALWLHAHGESELKIERFTEMEQTFEFEVGSLEGIATLWDLRKKGGPDG